MKDQIKEILCDILEIDDFEWSDEKTPGDFDDWDSLKNLRIITALEEEFDLQFTMAEIQEMQTLGKVLEIVAKHRA